ncbi:hypothetical protein DFH28DRAFT_936107 [Melampsora americana]|nr:hypothetical protein DFH28DRAFT_936107 [Melampsora americana]
MPISLARKAQRARRMAERQLTEKEAQIISFIENNTADSEDEAECDEDEIQQELWPVFTTCDTSKPHQGKRKNRSGQPVNYRKPTTHLDPLNSKLVPKVVPKQTRHNRKKKAIAAAGKNFNMISNWAIQEKPVAAAPSNPNQVDITDSSSVIDVSDDYEIETDDSPNRTEDEAEQTEEADEETEDKCKIGVESHKEAEIYDQHIPHIKEERQISFEF